MTRPDGEIIAEVVVDTRSVTPAVERALRRTARDTDDDARLLGRTISQHIGEGMEDESRHLGSSLGSAIRDGVDRDRHTFRRTGRRIATEIGEGLADSTNVFRQVFSGLSNTLGPLLGSIFNVSGRSPIMLILIALVLGAIVALVAAAIHGVRALLSLLALIPNLLFAIGLQAAALFFIFNGLFEGIGALAAAKNIGELNKALEGMNPAMAQFIRTLYPLKELFSAISDVAKTQFFGAIGDVFLLINQAIGTTLMNSIANVSAALGRMFRTILEFFTQPLFRNFMDLITPEIVYWLDKFGPAVVRFLEGMTRFGIATLPFLRWFGEAFNRWITSIGEWFDKLASDPEFLSWLDRAKVTISLFIDLLSAIWETIQIIARNIEKAGGDDFLKAFTDFFKLFNLLIASDIGVKAMRSFLIVMAILLVMLLYIISIIVVLFYLLERFGAFISYVAQGLRDFFILLWELFKMIWEQLKKIWEQIRTPIEAFFSLFDNKWAGIGGVITSALTNALELLKTFLTSTLPKKVTDWFATQWNKWYQAGKDLMQQLIYGAYSAIPLLGPLIARVGNAFSGGGGTNVQGGANPNAFGGGGAAVAPATGGLGNLAVLGGPGATSNFSTGGSTENNFGSGAVQVSIVTQNPPTESQAMAIGQGVGTGIQQQLAERSVRMM